MKQLSLVAFLLISLQNFAQLNFNSPYSIFALGDVRGSGTVYNQSMGGVGVSSGNSLYLNTINPAMLTRNHTVIFDLALTSTYRVLSTDITNEKTFGANFDGLQLGFPISPKFTTALGIVPLTTRSYNFGTIQEIDDQSYSEQSYTGTGGLTKINWSTGYKFWKHKRRQTSLAVGLEIAYVFGPLEEESFSRVYIDDVPNQYTASAFVRQSFSGFNFKPGILFRREFNKSEIAHKRYRKDEATGDSTLYFELETTMFSGQNIDMVSEKMVVGELLVLFANRNEVVVSKLFRGRKLASYFVNSLKAKKPYNVGIYIRAKADEYNREAVLAEYEKLIAQMAAGQYTSPDSLRSAKQLTKRFLKKGSGVFFNLGATYGLSREFSGKSHYSINQYNDDGARQYADTIFHNTPTQFTMPSSFEFGISFDKPTPTGIKKNGKAKTSVWSIALDYSQYNWTEYANPVDLLEYENSYTVKVGGEICPDIAQKRHKGFGSQVFYRFGANFGKAPHQVDGKDLLSAGVTAGFGLPMYGTKQLPRYINIMLGYTKRGLRDDLVIKEDFFNLSFSFNFNNKFAKRKAGL